MLFASKALAQGQCVRYEKNGLPYVKHNTERAGQYDAREHASGYESESKLNLKDRENMAAGLDQLCWELPSNLMGITPNAGGWGMGSGSAGSDQPNVPLAITYGDMPDTAKAAVTEAIEVDCVTFMANVVDSSVKPLDQLKHMCYESCCDICRAHRSSPPPHPSFLMIIYIECKATL